MVSYLHGVGLSRRRLSIGKDSAIVATQYICNSAFTQTLLPFN